MNLNKVDKIYVCHYQKLTDRVKLVESQLDFYDLDWEWVLEYDKEDLIHEELTQKLPLYDKEFSVFGSSRKLRLSEVSLLMKHYSIWNKIVENEIQNTLVLEDDFLLCNDFFERFNNQISNLDLKYDLVWVGGCCNLKAPFNGEHLIKWNGSRCTHAYLISYECAKKAIDKFKLSNLPADFYFNFLISVCKLNNYWMEPVLITQNSIYESSIQNN